MHFSNSLLAVALAVTASAAPLETRAAPVDQLVGFAAGTTGGSGKTVTTVTSCSALSSALKAGGNIKVNGLLSGCGIIKVPSDTSVIGVGSNSGIVNGGLKLQDANNVIIRNLKFSPEKKGDALSLDTAIKVWIDHNEFYSVGLTGGKDDYDGLLDITHASDQVTVSWNKFRDHWKGSLVGHSDNNSGEDSGKLRVTYHHNSFVNVNSRLPSVRFGTAHVYSSCYTDIPTSGINIREGANALVEENSFTNVQLAITTNTDSKIQGYATSKNNILTSSTTLITRTSSWTPSYSYSVDAAAQACSVVNASAGVGKISA